MHIRKAKIKDIEQIMLVFKDYEKASVGYLPAKYKSLRNKKKPFKKHLRKALAKDIRQRNACLLVAEEGGKVLGFIFGEIRDDKNLLFNRPKTGELYNLAVLKTHQGKGIASMLWKGLRAWFAEKKCKMITLSVNSNNRNAQEIYKRW
ncbi:MAG: GNAT family N-acetyltransferase, partial [Nanoarchaeota archaeon]